MGGRRGRIASVAVAVAVGAALASGAGCGPLASPSAPGSPASPAPAVSGKRTAPAPAAPAAEELARDALPATARPLAYQLHLDVDPQAQSFAGEVAIDVELVAPSRQLELHAVALTIESVELEAGGARWQPAARSLTSSRLRLELGRQVAGRLVVRVRYRGVTTADEQGLFRQDVAGAGYLYSQAEAQFARRILPCFDEPRHKVPWQVSVTAPAAARVFANGAVLADEPIAGERHRVTFAATPPMPSFLLAIAAGPFRVIDLGERGRGRFPVQLVLPAGLLGEPSADPHLARSITPRAIAAVERWFDRPLPLAKLDLVAVPRFFGAMENPGLITMNAGDMLGERDDHDLAALFARVLVHELAHQWFGNQLTPSRWGDLWISESLATWVAQQSFPELPELDATYARIASQVAARLADARAPQPLRRDELGPERMFDAISYDKGAAVVSMLAHWLGEARVKAALGRLLDERRDGSIDTEALAAAFGEVEPAAERVTLAAALQPGVPLVLFRTWCGAGKPPSLRVQRAEGQGPVPVCVRFAEGRGVDRKQHSLCRVVEGEREIPLPMPLGQCPAWLTGNDDLRGYYRVRFSGSFDPRGPIPPLSAQTRAEKLGLGWILAGELGSGAGDPAVSAPYFLAAWAELRNHLLHSPLSVELDLADLELMAALSRWIVDEQLPGWDAQVERRAAAMLEARVLASSSEPERARLARTLEVLVDLPWPDALTRAAWARLSRGAPGRSASRAPVLAPAFSASSSARARDWHLALRSGRPEPFARLLAQSADASLSSSSSSSSSSFDDGGAPLFLSRMAARSIPALFAALDRGELRWSQAVPALVELLGRRASQGALVTALAARGDALGRQLAPVELTSLLEAARWLCSRKDGQVFERTFAPLVARVTRGKELLAQVVAQVNGCEALRDWHHRALRAWPGRR